MATKHIHFPLTTAQQLALLFEAWQATGHVTAACRTAHVGRETFYYWKPRFVAQGFPGLAEFASRAAKEPHRTPAAVAQQVLALRRAHPAWGKKRLADELAKANNGVPLVGPNTVKRILHDAGLWTITEAGGGKKDAPPASRSAEQPGQTLNVELLLHSCQAVEQALARGLALLLVESCLASAPDHQHPVADLLAGVLEGEGSPDALVRHESRIRRFHSLRPVSQHVFRR